VIRLACLLCALPAGAALGQETLYRQAGRMLLVGTRGDAVRPGEDLERLVCGIKVGGILLFDTEGDHARTPRNIRSKQQLKRLTADLQSLARRCGDWPLLIAADVEGGSVNRMAPVEGLAELESAASLGKKNPTETFRQAELIGEAMAETGVNWDLAPVVDVSLNPRNPVISMQSRSFSQDHGAVAKHAEAFIRGLRKNGVLNCLKHFPGHGSSVQDSHRGAVDVSKTADLLLELWPFKELLRHGLADCVMTAHVVHSDIDPARMATVSPAAVSGFLRQSLGYDGLVLSDDLQMAALREKYTLEESAVAAVRAGVDMLTLANSVGDYDTAAAMRVHRALLDAVREGRVRPSRVKEASRRILALKAKLREEAVP